ncbi:MAG: cupin domain-containing protein [Pseudomonadota bacterium]
MTDPKPVWRAAEITATGFAFQHPLDPSSKCTMAPVSRMAGMKDVAVNVVTIAPGEQAFPYHTHHGEEEWMYIVSGAASVRLGDETHTMADGDFVAFYKSGPSHCVRNIGTSELVCLMGGHIVSAKVIDMPELDKRVTWTDAGVHEAPLSAFRQFAPPSPPKGEA